LLYLPPLAIITLSFYRDAAQHACDQDPRPLRADLLAPATPRTWQTT
jgi:hypothetical protein